MTKTGIKKVFTEVSLGWKCFGLHNKDSEVYTFKKIFVRDFIRKTIKDGKIVAYNCYFLSKQFDVISLNIKKHLNNYDNEISAVFDKYIECIGK